MKKFTASELIDRAYDLADIKNTDFLTHEENTQYINDAWKMVYQWLINHGDKQFLKEVKLGGSSFNSYVEYDLPKDLYQICSIKDELGHIVSRKAISESVSSATYEVFNDKLRLYGTVSGLILTYYTVPVWITYPEKPKKIDLGGRTIKDTCGNKVLLSDGEIQDVITGEVLGNVSSTAPYLLGNNHVFDTTSSTSSRVIYRDYNDGSIYTGYNNGKRAIKDYLGNVYQESNGTVSFMGVDRGTYEVPSLYSLQGLLKNAYVVTNANNVRIYKESGDYYEQELSTGDETITIIGENRFVLRDLIFDYDIYTDEVRVYQDENVVNKVGALHYGLINYDGVYTVYSAYEDTVFNFPNEIYVELLSCDLAIRYMMKQNADPTGLNNQYQAMKDTFMNTLGQDASYTRISNIYRS